MSDQPIDKRLALGYGSAWHLLRCLGWRRNDFNALIALRLQVSNVTWLDFPFYAGNTVYPTGMLVRDREWTRLGFINDQAVQQAYNEYWPRRGSQQNWDAVGKVVESNAVEWVLLEAKAYPNEIKSDGTVASESDGRPQIRAAFQETLKALGYSDTEACDRAEEWLKGHYQHANRLATLHFLMKQSIPARLVFLYLCGDKRPGGQVCPRSEREWQPFIDEVHHSLGLKGTSELENRLVNVFVNVDLRAE